MLKCYTCIGGGTQCQQSIHELTSLFPRRFSAWSMSWLNTSASPNPWFCELLEASEPALAQVVAMLKAAESMTEAARKRLLQDMDSTITSMEVKKDQALALAAGMTADLVAQAEAIKGRRPGRQLARKRSAGGLAVGTSAVGDQSPAPIRPPSSNRGQVKSTSYK